MKSIIADERLYTEQPKRGGCKLNRDPAKTLDHSLLRRPVHNISPSPLKRPSSRKQMIINKQKHVLPDFSS